MRRPDFKRCQKGAGPAGGTARPEIRDAKTSGRRRDYTQRQLSRQPVSRGCRLMAAGWGMTAPASREAMKEPARGPSLTAKFRRAAHRAESPGNLREMAPFGVLLRAPPIKWVLSSPLVSASSRKRWSAGRASCGWAFRHARRAGASGATIRGTGPLCGLRLRRGRLGRCGGGCFVRWGTGRGSAGAACAGGAALNMSRAGACISIWRWWCRRLRAGTSGASSAAFSPRRSGAMRRRSCRLGCFGRMSRWALGAGDGWFPRVRMRRAGGSATSANRVFRPAASRLASKGEGARLRLVATGSAGRF